ncbi:MAG TPA: hypothetical protein VM432_01725 [Bdellovibrionales bacterium]|nr:hypothetical protein [Bdellovibrionales bacterium]
MDGIFSHSRLLIAGLGLLIFTSPLAHAEDEESQMIDYDTIVDQLHRETNTSKTKRPGGGSDDPFAEVWMHGGVGLATVIQSVHLESGKSHVLNQRGIQAALGIDLFSPNWMAEGTARNFGESEENAIRSTIQEFELKVLYKNRTGQRLGYRVGGGLTARYLSIKEPGEAQKDYTTPSSVATAGLDFYMNDRFSIGADLNGRSAMIGETIDKNSIDGTIRVDAHF